MSTHMKKKNAVLTEIVEWLHTFLPCACFNVCVPRQFTLRYVRCFVLLFLLYFSAALHTHHHNTLHNAPLVQ